MQAKKGNKMHKIQFPGETVHQVHLTKEKETLLITLYAKALDNRAKHPILGDTTADELVRSIDYNFQKFEGAGSDNLTVVRAKQIDDWVREFIAQHPDALVLYLGCGLDTRVMRIDPPPEVRWYDLDYPEVIALREQFFPKRDGYAMIAASVTTQEWLASIPNDRPVMIVAEGLLEYLPEQDVQRLLNRLTSHFQHGQLVFDVLSSLAIKWGRANLQETTGAAHQWAVDDTRRIETLDPKLKKMAELSVVEMSSLKKLPWTFRVVYTSMRLIPPLRKLLRLLRYQF